MVTDFGLAKKTESDSNLTGTGQILGTPSYMPPEQASGKIDEVTELADIYSLGAILYALVTARPPFQADNPLDTLMQVLEREPVSPRTLNPKVPQDLETICLKCLEKDRRRRYTSANDLVKELQRFLDGRPILARPISRPARAWRWCRRNPIVASLAALVAISLVAGTVVSTNFAIEAHNRAVGERTQREEAERQAEVADNERNRADDEAAEARRQAKLANTRLYAFRLNEAQGLWRQEPARALEILNDPQSCPPDSREFCWAHLHHLCTRSQLTTLVSNAEVRRLMAVRLSPDGRVLVARGDGRSGIKLLDPQTGAQLGALPLPGESSVSFSADGGRMAVAHAKTVSVVDTESWHRQPRRRRGRQRRAAIRKKRSNKPNPSLLRLPMHSSASA